jgi:hypothetical protein
MDNQPHWVGVSVWVEDVLMEHKNLRLIGSEGLNCNKSVDYLKLPVGEI